MLTVPHCFARRELSLSEAEFAVLGIPYDSSQSYRTGSRYAPSAIREASRELEDYDMELKFDLTELRICDLGDVEVSQGCFEETKKRATQVIGHVLNAGAVPVCLGGEHIITYFSALVAREAFFVVYDAHLDYREEYLGNPYSHASAMRRVGEVVGEENMLLLGVRSASREELEQAGERGLRYVEARVLRSKPGDVAERVLDEAGGRRLYLSIDLDVLDPAEAGGVCNPEPGGLRYAELVESLGFLSGCELKGFDLTELCPSYDPCSQVLAAKLILKALSIHKA